MYKKFLAIFSIFLLGLILIACEDNGGDPIVSDAAFDAIFEEIALPESTMSNLSLKNKSALFPDASIAWRSTNQKVITNQGEVRRPDQPTTVEMVAVVTLEGKNKSHRYAVSVQPVDSMIFDLNAYRSDYGYASIVLTNRNGQEAVEVATEIEFLDALANKSIKIIKITADLNMGFLNVMKKLEEAGKTEQEISNYTDGSFYRQNANVPLLHPTLKEEGVGQMIIQDRTSLMIYSEYGAKISHLTSIIKTSSDIVIRNLHFTGIWEWDDGLAADYDENDWDYFTVETTNGLWIDHVKFDQSYDGLVDVKGGTSNFTISYLDLNFVENQFIRDQIEWLEENYMDDPTKTISNSRYVKLRKEAGMSMEQIIRYTSAQKKGFNFGNTTMGMGFKTITITMHHLRIFNLADRLPRLRQGDVHVYNVLIDNTELENIRQMIASSGTSLPSQAMVPTEEGAVLFENSKLIETVEPIKTHQDNIMDPAYTGRYKVLNSILIKGINYYKGSSYEGQPDGDPYSPWKQSNTNMPRIEFFLRNYQEIPYRYKDTEGNGAAYNYMVEPEMLGRVLEDNYVGPGEIPDFNWQEIRKLLSNPISPTAVRGHRIDPDSIEIEDDLLELGETYVEKNPQVFNFYLGGPQYQRNVDYTLEIDKSQLDVSNEGTYDVIYTFKNMHNDWDEYVYVQSVIVYDPEGPNEIYESSISDEFDAKININYSVYTAEGTLYYLISNTNNLTLEQVKVHEDLQSTEITSVYGKLVNVETNRLSYVYMYTVRQNKESELVVKQIRNEQIIQISTVAQLNDMITSFASTGKYYILMNDIDLSQGRMDALSTSNVFSGIFDGNGYKLYNYKKTMLRGGLFMTINGGMIKNLVLDDFEFTVDSIYSEDTENPGTFKETKPSDDSGLLATYVYGYARFENITIQNSKLITTRNYGGALLGRVRTGEAYYEGIKILNVDIISSVPQSKYTGGLIGGIEPNTKLFMKDIFVDGLRIEHQQSDMIGALVGRVRSYLDVENVVMLGVEITGRHNLGILVGKEDNTTTYIQARNFFAEADFTFQTDVSGIYSDYFGYIIGNPDAGKTQVFNYFVIADNDFEGKKPKGLNINANILASISEVNEAWWNANLPSIATSDKWSIDENGLAYLK